MKKILLIVFGLSLSVFCAAQDSVTLYYADKHFDQIVDAEKAKYSETTVRKNGAVITTKRDLKKNEVIFREGMKGEEPVGVWVTRAFKGFEERDYNFELKYGKKNCDNTGVITKTDDFMMDNAASQYTAPVLSTGETDMMAFIRKNLRYPAYARRHGVDGTVEAVFTITKEGGVDDIVVIKGVHVSLDKEAVRMIRLLKFNKPPMVNGQAREVCVKLPLRFKLN